MTAPANDAHLVQNVRSALGREDLFKDSGRINISSCEFIVTLHGNVQTDENRRGIEALVSRIDGVRGVENRMKVRSEANLES